MIRSAATQTSTAVARQGTRRGRRLTLSHNHPRGGVGARCGACLSYLSAQPQDASRGGRGLLQSNALAAQHLGPSPHAHQQSARGADLLRQDPAHSEAWTRLVQTLLYAPSAVIDSSLAINGSIDVQQGTIALEEDDAMDEERRQKDTRQADRSVQQTEPTKFVSDGWGELDQAPLQKEAANLAAVDATAADDDGGDGPSSSWWEETALLQDQEEKHAKRRMLRQAQKVQATLFSICSPRRSTENDKIYQPRLHVESAMSKFRFLVRAERDDHPILREFAIDVELYPRLIEAMPRRFLGPKMEILKQYVAAVEARAMAEQQERLNENADAAGGDGGGGEVGLVLDLDARALYKCCEAPGTYAHRQRKRGTVDIDANAAIMDTICFLGDTLINTPLETQRRCLPRLMASALSVKNEQSAWTYAADILWHMDQERFAIDFKLYNHILRSSTFRNTPHFPFWKVLKVLSHDVEARKIVDMCDVVQLLVNYFPYTDAAATKAVMRSMLSLHQPKPTGDDCDNEKEKQGEENESDATISFPSFDDDVSFPLNCNTHPDRGVLQAIAYAGAAAGDPDMVLMAWDLSDQAGYSPSAEMYESIVTAFASSVRQDHNAFAALCEMEEAEIPISRALIESFSTQVGYTPGRIRNARFILTNEMEGTAITTASLNVIMAAFAGRGDAEGSFETFALFERYDGAEPNADTYSYMLESLATKMTAERNIRGDGPSTEDCGQNVAAAREVLREAKEAGMSSGNIVHQYLRTLCAADYLEEALESLKQAVESRERVLMESFSLVAVRHAKEGHFETAEYICHDLYTSAGYGEVPRNVIGRIKNIQNFPKRRERKFRQDI